MIQNDPPWGQDPLSVTSRRERLVTAVIEKYVLEHGPLSEIRHQVQLTTFGGTGSTALSDYLRSHGVQLPDTPGEAPFKHQRIPPAKVEVPEGFRVLYLYSDPRNAMLSIFRRGAIWEHYSGLFGRKPDHPSAQVLGELSTFLRGQRDEFELLDHVENWLRPGKGYPVMFLDFEALPRVWDSVVSFLGLPGDVACMPMKQRHCAWESLSVESQRTISGIYAPVIARLAELPDVYIVDRECLSPGDE